MHIRKAMFLIFNNVYIFAKLARNIFTFNDQKYFFFLDLKNLNNKIRLVKNLLT